MDRTERFYKIELLLRSRGCVSFAALQAELEAELFVRAQRAGCIDEAELSFEVDQRVHENLQ